MLVVAILLLFPAWPAEAGMRVVHSRHYTIHSDLPADLTEDLARRLDEMYDEYSRRLTDFRPAGRERLDVYLYSRRADYLREFGNDGQHTAGIFLPHRNCLAAVLEGSTRQDLRRTLQHEAFHQFAHNRIAPDLPPWLNEGLAELFEDGMWTGSGFVLGEVPPWRVRRLHRDMQQQRLIDFPTFMKLDHPTWLRRIQEDRDLGHLQYNQAWAMVHFLVFATEGTGQPYYRQRFVDFLRRLNRGQDADAAFVAAFSNNIAGFQERFVQYARNLQPTEAAQYSEHVEILANMLRITHEQGRRYDTIDAFRSDVRAAGLQLWREEDGLRSTTAADPGVYFTYSNGPTIPSSRLRFEHVPGAPLPDIVCQPMNDLILRAHFFIAPNGTIDHELLIEPAR